MKGKSWSKLYLLVGIISLLLITCAQSSFAVSEGGIFQMTGDIVINKDQVIDGDVDAMAGNITIYGQVNGNVTAMAGNIDIYGKVIGDVHCMLGRVRLREAAEVIGDVTVMAGKIQRDQGTQITGKLRELTSSNQRSNSSWNSRHFYWNNFGSNFSQIPWFVVLWGVITGLIGWLAISLLIMFFFQRHIQRLANRVIEQPGYYFLLGLIAFILTPLAAVLLGITFFGIPLIPVLILAVIGGALFGQLAVARVIGDKVKAKLNLKYQTDLVRVIVGILVIFGITLIPIIGWVFFLITTCIGLGVVLKNRFGVERKSRERDEQDENDQIDK